MSNLNWLIIIAVLLFRMTSLPSMTLGMQMTITHLSQVGKAMLGRVRSFSALGFGAAGIIAGQLFALGGYTLIFWVAVAFALASIQLSTVFPAKTADKTTAEDAPRQPRNRGFYVLAASQFFVWMGAFNSFAFIFIHFTDNLGVPPAQIGIWAAILGAVEAPFLFLMDSILPKVRIRIAYIISVFGIALFTLLLGLVQSLPMLAFVLVLRGLSWPGFHLSSFQLVNAISRPRNVSTNQALLQVTIPGAALLLTGSFFGWAYDNLGAGAFFALCALAYVIGAGVLIVGFRLFETQVSAAHAD